MRNPKFFKNNSQGFTLIELLVVIAIIGILATMSVVALSGAREKARDSRRLSDIKNIQTALEMYYSASSSYPSSLGSSIEVGDNTYMGDVPNNPDPYPGICPGGDYQYYTSSNGTTYSIGYCLGTSASLDDEGKHCATPAGINDGFGCVNGGCTPPCDDSTVSFTDPY